MFIHNSNPYLKNQHRIKEPKKLYKISSELEEIQERRKEETFRDLTPDKTKDILDFLKNLN